MADILDKRPVDAEMTIFKTEVEPNKLNTCIDNILMRVDRLETKFADVQPVNQWISCQGKMPEEYKTVLVYEKDYGVMIGELEKKFFDTQYFIARKSGLILRTTEVTHWQPLPEPPKDGDADE